MNFGTQIFGPVGIEPDKRQALRIRVHVGIHPGMPVAQAGIESPGKIEFQSFQMVPAVQPAIDIRIARILEYLGQSRHFSYF